MKKIKLTKGYEAIVDDADYEKLNQFNWYARKGHKTYYANRYSNDICIIMHRLIMNVSDNQLIDHINGNGLDNRKKNLRFATKTENLRNRDKTKRNKSGYKGVCYDKKRKKWRNNIMINSKQIHLGRFDNLIDAAKSYNIAAIKYFGKFAKLNIIKEN